MRLPRVLIQRPVAVPTAIVLIEVIFAMCVAMADEPFFPDRIFGREKEDNDFVVEWYSKHLKAMKEPSLWKLAQNDRAAIVYRFLWLPTFDRPVSVRLSKSGDSAMLHAVELDGRGGYEPGKIAVRRTLKLDGKQWEDFKRRVDKAHFWPSPTEKADDDIILDGDQLILEGVMTGKYHIVDRLGAVSDADYAELCRQMLVLSGLDVMKTWQKYRE